MQRSDWITLLILSPLIIWITSAGVIELWFYGKGRFVDYLVSRQKGPHDGQG